MCVLALETATTLCGAALVENGTVLAEVRHIRPRAHAELCAGLVESLLQQSGRALNDVSGIAVSSGPGSFTGLRIGMALAKSLAYSQKLPIVAVPTMDAMVQTLAPLNGRLLAVLPSRRGEVYAAMYKGSPAGYTALKSADAVEIAALPAWAGEVSHLCGPGMEALPETAFSDAVRLTAAQASPSPAGVGLIGAARLQQGDADDVQRVEPMYIKSFFTTAKKVTAGNQQAGGHAGHATPPNAA